MVRERVCDGTIRLKYVPMASQAADILTKGLPKQVHLSHLRSVGLLGGTDAKGHQDEEDC
jgi:hypothetical protein